MLFKDEVREVGSHLGLPDEIVHRRQPFPGPGLAVRCLERHHRRSSPRSAEADAIVRQEIEAAGLSSDIWQYFAVLCQSIDHGVMGDGRTCREPAYPGDHR
ncbi:MAG: hypothetical protein R3A46_06505 [Thermomicrobiales bacterium]